MLLHDVGKPPTFTIRERIRFDNHVEVGARMAEEICGRLRISTRETERIVELVRHHLRFKDFPRMKRSTQLRFLRMEGFEEHLELHRLDCLSSHRDLTNYELARRMLEETPKEEIKPAPLLRGNDLIAQGYASRTDLQNDPPGRGGRAVGRTHTRPRRGLAARRRAVPRQSAVTRA